MSNSPILPPTNPYQPSYATYAPQMHAPAKLPTFCLVMFILGLVFAVLRVPLVIMGAFTWFALQPNAENQALFTSVPFEVLTGAAISLFGIPGNIGMLLKQRWGVVLGFLTVAASLASLGVALWQLSLMFQVTDDPAERAGFVGGAAVTLLIRITIIGLYALAILKLSQWLRSQQPAT